MEMRLDFDSPLVPLYGLLEAIIEWPDGTRSVSSPMDRPSQLYRWVETQMEEWMASDRWQPMEGNDPLPPYFLRPSDQGKLL